MVLASQIRQAAKRIPMIKFRSGVKNQHSEAAPAIATATASAPTVSIKH